MSDDLVYGCKKRTVRARLSYFDANGNRFHVRSAVSGPPNGQSCQWKGKGKCPTCVHAEQNVCSPADKGGIVTISRHPCFECAAWMDVCGVSWEVEVEEDERAVLLELAQPTDDELLQAIVGRLWECHGMAMIIRDEPLRERAIASLHTSRDALQLSISVREKNRG